MRQLWWAEELVSGSHSGSHDGKGGGMGAAENHGPFGMMVRRSPYPVVNYEEKALLLQPFRYAPLEWKQVSKRLLSKGFWGQSCLRNPN
jgi:hypothetical protein